MPEIEFCNRITIIGRIIYKASTARSIRMTVSTRNTVANVTNRVNVFAYDNLGEVDQFAAQDRVKITGHIELGEHGNMVVVDKVEYCQDRMKAAFEGINYVQDNNEVLLRGILAEKPVANRKSKNVVHFSVKTKDAAGKDVICRLVCYGRLAAFVQTLDAGTRLDVLGYVQSRNVGEGREARHFQSFVANDIKAQKRTLGQIEAE